MKNRIPAYFQLDRYNIEPEDIVRLSMGCEPADIHPIVILMPVWRAEIFGTHVDSMSTMVNNRVYQLEFQGHSVSVIRSGIGAPLAGDMTLALGCTPCENMKTNPSLLWMGLGRWPKPG